MKRIAFVSAALLAVAALSATPAYAERRHGGTQKSHGWKWKKVCKTRYFNGHKGTWCRNVRVRWKH